MRISRRLAVILALSAAGALAVAGIAIAAPSSTFSFNFSPSKVPKKKYKPGALETNLVTHYTNPGNNNPGGAVERTQIYLDKNWKINPKVAGRCKSSKLSGKTMKQAMAACPKALVGKGTATATANGQFTIHGCVLLFNGKPQKKKPTLQVFTRVVASNPSHITCSNPKQNSQGNATVLLKGVLKDASGAYGKVLDVNHITQSASFPLEVFKTKIKKGNYVTARCKAKNKKWKMQTTWTYNNGAKKTVQQTQKCKVGH
jgi:hypothetical protein